MAGRGAPSFGSIWPWEVPTGLGIEIPLIANVLGVRTLDQFGCTL